MMERYTGCMLGLAVGDALGTPVEGMKAGHIRQMFDEVTDYVDPMEAFPDRPGKWRLPGLYTDDTQQALAIAEMLAINGETDVRALADLYLRLADEGPSDAPFGSHRGTGAFFRRSVDAMRRADDPRTCGQPSAGNGAAMRIAPVALFHARDDDFEGMARSVIEVTLLTHHDPRGIASALAQAYTVARFTGAGDGDSPDPREVAEELPARVREWEELLEEEYADFLDPGRGRDTLHMFSDALRPLGSLLRENQDDLALKTIVRGANECLPDAKIAQAHSGFAPASVITSIYRGLSARSFTEGLIAAINAGGDADTVGAMTGAILGARFGEGAIPSEWIEGLLNAEQIRARGRALYEHTIDWGVWEDLVLMERRLTEMERRALTEGFSDHEKEIERRKSRQTAKREQAAKRKQSDYEDQGFAPPPEIWLREKKPKSAPPPPPDPNEEWDPIQAKKDKARRGRKRIPWKEEQRRKKKQS